MLLRFRWFGERKKALPNCDSAQFTRATRQAYPLLSRTNKSARSSTVWTVRPLVIRHSQAQTELQEQFRLTPWPALSLEAHHNFLVSELGRANVNVLGNFGREFEFEARICDSDNIIAG